MCFLFFFFLLRINGIELACSLGQVSAGTGLLCTVRLCDAEGVAQGGYAGLQVELGGLRQVRLLAKIVEIKERGAALHLSLHQGRRSDLCKGKGTEAVVREHYIYNCTQPLCSRAEIGEWVLHLLDDMII